MTPRTCIYKCGTILDGWDDDARRYKEAGTGYLHTKERCQELKAKLEQKNDHGNELGGPSAVEREADRLTKTITASHGTGEKALNYVDHTAKGLSKVKIFSSDSRVDTQNEYNQFLEDNKDKIKTQGAHDHVTMQGNKEPLRFTIYLYYEELKQQ